MKVWYANGAGNDFAIIDARNLDLDFSELAQTLCKSTGADGFMAIGNSEIADFKLHFYNADGSRGEMCGNGSRCICRIAFDLGIVSEEMSIETDAGLIYGKRLTEDRYQILLNNPSVLTRKLLKNVAYVELGDPGVPHAVTKIHGLTWDMKDSLLAQAQELRNHPEFPKGANVNFYTWLDHETIRILTFERGVENYTLACGTGSAATAAVLWTRGLLPGGKLTVKNPGGDLIITIEGRKKNIRSIWLDGPTEIVKEFDI